MRPLENSTASVRIELSEDGGMAAPSPQGDDGRSGRGRRGILTAVAALAVVMGVVLITRPDDGESAVGTPITAPSTTVDARTNTSESNPDGLTSELRPETIDEAVAQGDVAPAFETAELDFFPFGVIEADLGWIALGFGDGGAAGLWRSLDGLNWNRLVGDGMPDGDILGFDWVDGEYLLAVDDTFSWSKGARPPGSAEFHISIWRSPDVVSWSQATDRPSFDGSGFPYPVNLSESAYTIPSIGPASDGDYDLLVRYLSQVLEPERARRVCRSETESVVDDRQIALLDCSGEELARISRLDDPELFESLGPDFCLDIAREAHSNTPSVIYVDSLTGEHRISLGDQFGLFGALIDDRFLTASSSFGVILPTECINDSTEVRGDANILIWGPEGQTTAVLPEEIHGGSVGGSFRIVHSSPDGTALIVGESGVWAGAPPYDRWDLVLDSSVESGGPGADEPLALTFDGTFVMGVRGQNLFFADPGGEWIEVEFGRRLGFPQLLLATDDFAVVMNQGRGSELIKIPLT